jgi:dihydroflavonol-4-reductase
MAGALVLVTGGSGFIGAHCIVQLIQGGYQVRTTVRNLAREGEVRAMVRQGGVKRIAISAAWHLWRQCTGFR